MQPEPNDASEMSPECVAVLALARRRWIAAKEEAKRGRGPISAEVQANGFRFDGDTPEALLEMMYWLGVESGLWAPLSAEVRARLADGPGAQFGSAIE